MKNKSQKLAETAVVSERIKKVKNLFLDALEIEEPHREKFLRENCGDPEIKTEVEKLLEAHFEAEDFIENPIAKIGSLFNSDGDQKIPKHFGNYKIIREIGAGGMGAVFLAERDDGEFTQKVAIKIVRQTIAESEVINRFRRERQILANLNHPNIARLVDGGVSNSGEPFLAMEYVKGVPITQFADEQNLSVEERLRLFLKVCAAVSYAHRNLTIHRDIKPSNILVTKEGEPKLLDFGLAKLLGEGLNFDPTQTQSVFHAFTPVYASPEQILRKNISTATDVYSLGIVLFELLTGEHPFHFENKKLQEILQIIDTTEPSRPSDALTRGHKKAEKKDTSAQNISTSPHLHVSPSQLRGDLDNIILKALRVEAERRYKSVEAFAEDIKRHLQGLPVWARPQTFGYRASKLIQRNKIAATASVLIFVSLISGIVMTLWQARRAEEQAAIASEQAAIAEQETRGAQAERERAQAALTRAEKSKKFLRDMLSYANPAWYSRGAGKKDVTILEAVNDAGNRIDTEFADFPEVRADLHFTLGEIYNMLRYENATEYVARTEKARLHLAECLRLRRELYGEENAQTAEAYYLYAGTQAPDLDAEIFYLRKALEIFRNTAPDNANVPYLLMDLGGNLGKKNEFDEAESLNQEALEILRRKNGEQHLSVVFPAQNLGRIALKRGQPDKAEIILKQALEIAGTKDKPTTLTILIVLKEVHEAQGDKLKAADVKLEIARLEQK